MVPEKRVADVNTVIQQGRMTVELLRTVSDSTNTPYLRPIAGASALLMDSVVIAIACIIELAQFTEVTDLGSWDLLRSVSGIVEKLDENPGLQGRYFIALSGIPNQETPAVSYMLKALSKFELASNVSAQATVYHDLSLHYLYEHGDIKKAQETCTRALALARRTNDHNVLGRVLRRMASVEHHVGNLRSAWAFTLEAQAHAQAAGDLETEFNCVMNRVSHFITAGNYHRASALTNDLLCLAEGLSIENSERGLNPLFMLGEIHLRKTEYDEARRINQNLADRLRRDDGMKDSTHALALYNMFLVDVCTGRNSATHESIAVFRRLRSGVHWMLLCDLVGADLFHRQGELTRAAELYTKSLAVARGQYAETTNECFQKLGDNAVARSQMDVAFQYYVLHLAQSRNMDDLENTHQALRHLGEYFLSLGRR